MKIKYEKFLSTAIACTMLFSSVCAVPAFAEDADVQNSIVALADDAAINITESGGDMETAYAKWKLTSGSGTISGYRVYYKRTSDAEYSGPIDNALIRKYNDDGNEYYRADVVGIPEDTYKLKVVAVKKDGETETEVGSAETPDLNVIAHDRSGYAFISTEHANVSNGVGAYKMNGTLKDNAEIIYITENTKDTVKAQIVTDAKKGTKTECTGLLEILTAMKKGVDTRPFCFRIIGQVTDMANIDSIKEYKGDICIDLGKKGNAGITIEGIGDDATADGWGIRLKGAQNIEIRNLGIMNVDSDEGDNIGLQQDAYNVWVHNCDFYYGHAGSDKDQVKGDGALDCKKSSNITFSYNHFYDNGKCCLLGLKGESDKLLITYHHNWFDHSDSRHPRIRFFTAHVYNNYYDGNSKYGVGSTLGSSVFVENNYFRNCKYPILTSMQGSDIYDTSANKYDPANMATFSKEAGGTIKEFGNKFEGDDILRFVNQRGVKILNGKINTTETPLPAADVAQIDAYSASDRNEKVPDTIKSVSGGNTYNNFDTKDDMYDYEVDTPDVARDKVKAYAGRAYTGDFHWNFNAADDDKSHEVNVGLKNAVVGYKTKLVSVGGMDGESIDSGKVPDTDWGEDEPPTETSTGGSGSETPAETTTSSSSGSGSETPVETTTSSGSGSGSGTTPEKPPVQAAGTGKWDFGNPAFLAYPKRENFGASGDVTIINGLTIYYPADGVKANSLTATDGTPLAGCLKFNTTDMPTDDDIANGDVSNVIKFRATKGETVKVYYCASSKNKAPTLVIGDNNKAIVKTQEAESGSTSTVSVAEYKVETSGDIWIYVTGNNANIYKIELLDASGGDSLGTSTELVGDVDGDGVITVNDVMIVYDYAKNGSSSAVEESEILAAFDGKKIDETTAKELLDKVLSNK